MWYLLKTTAGARIKVFLLGLALLAGCDGKAAQAVS